MAMPLSIASAVFAGISALSDAISLYRAARSKGQDAPPVAEIERALREGEAKGLRKQLEARELGRIIGDDELEVLNNNIDKAKKRLIKSLRDPANDNQAKDNAIDIANSVICSELQRIKRLNGGAFPSGDYDRWWKEHECDAA